MRIAIALITAHLAASSAAIAQTPTLLADINTQPAGAIEINGIFQAVGDRIVFTAQRPEVGQELFACDTNGGGVSVVRDIWPGSGGSFPINAVSLGGRTVLWATDPEHGRELWTTDGTAAGTRLLRDIRPGPVGSPFNTGSMGVLNGRALFFADDGEHGVELWETDGTEAGTRLAVELAPGPEGVETYDFPHVLGDWFYFHATLPGVGPSTIRTDGTTANTVVLLSGGSGVFFHPFGDQVCFQVGQRLWQTDGTIAGTRPVEGPIASMTISARSTAQLGSDFYLSGYDSSISRYRALRLHRPSGEVSFLPFEPLSYVQQPDWVAMTAFESAGVDLYAINSGGVSRLSNAETGPLSADSGLVGLGGRLFFSSNRLHTTDGTVQGTRRFWDPTRPMLTTGEFVLHSQPVVNGRMFYRAAETVENPIRAIWRTDGTVDRTSVIGRVEGSTRGSDSQPIAEVNGRLYAMSHKPVPTLWLTDGTASGTRVVRELGQHVRLDSGNLPAIRGAAAAGERLVFIAADLTGQLRLWGSDGTAAGTVMLTPESFGFFQSELEDVQPAIVSAGDRVVVINNTRAPNRYEADFWTTDGTVAGTRLVETLYVWRTGIHRVATLGGRAVFVNPSSYLGTSFWVTDGSAEGTYPLWNTIVSGGLDVYAAIATGQGRVYGLTRFGAVWSTDGTPEGSRSSRPAPFGRVDVIKELLAVSPDVFIAIGKPPPLTRFSVYRVNVATGQLDILWAPPAQNLDPPIPSNLIMSDSRVYYSTGLELWRVEALAGRPERIATVANTARPVAGGVTFRQRVGSGVNPDWELFLTTGTALGSVQLTDYTRGYTNSGGSVTWTHPFRNGVIFAADDGIVGSEPWFIDLRSLPDCNNNGVRDPDECISGDVFDANRDLVPDECVCLADWNSDRVESLDDLFAFLNDWFAGDADADHSGATDVDDVPGFIGLWLSGCP